MNFAKSAWKLVVAIKDLMVPAVPPRLFSCCSIRPSSRPARSSRRRAPARCSSRSTGRSSSSPRSWTASPRWRAAPARRNIACATWSMPSRQRRTTARSRRWCSISTASAAAARSRCSASARRSTRCARPASRCSPIRRSMTTTPYLLAAHASEVWLSPLGMVGVTGPGGTLTFYKGLIDKVGANIHVYRVGKFKSAVEPYTRADQSPESRAANEALVTAIWEDWQANVGQARKKAQIAKYLADPLAAHARGRRRHGQGRAGSGAGRQARRRAGVRQARRRSGGRGERRRRRRFLGPFRSRPICAATGRRTTAPSASSRSRAIS